jgi:hypothetical protein
VVAVTVVVADNLLRQVMPIQVVVEVLPSRMAQTEETVALVLL